MKLLHYTYFLLNSHKFTNCQTGDFYSLLHHRFYEFHRNFNISDIIEHNHKVNRCLLASENGLFLTLGLGTSSARNENLRPLLNTNRPLISGIYGLRNHFWSLEIGLFMRKREENDFFSKICNNSILRFTYLKSAQNF